ncbi:MAG: adenylate kinase [Fidelibacterota bacterium]
MKMILLGPPGVGKGTQAQILSKEYGIPQISTGDILRSAIQADSELGKKANQYMSQGELVPDEIMLGLIRERLFGDDSPEGYILDGFPRTLVQAEALNQLFAENKTRLDIVLLLDADEELILKRLSSRRVCRKCKAVYNLLTQPPAVNGICDKCGGPLYQRDDDKIETIQNRLAVYRRQTEPLINFYKSINLLKTVDSSGNPREVHQNIMKQLEGN